MVIVFISTLLEPTI